MECVNIQKIWSGFDLQETKMYFIFSNNIAVDPRLIFFANLSS